MTTGTSPVGAQPAAHVEAVELAGEADVDDDELGPLPVDVGEALLGVGGLQHAEALASQVQRHQVGDVVVVLDDDDGRPRLAATGHQLGTGGLRRTGTLAPVAHRRHRTTRRRQRAVKRR